MGRSLLVADTIRDAHGVLGDALLVEDARIVAVGDQAHLRAEGIAETQYPGATIIPGLRDAHLHPVGYATALRRLSLEAARDFADLGDILAAAVRDLPPGIGLTALRLDDERLAEQRLPDRRLLDAVSTDHPMLLMRYCGHVAVANTAALRIAGIRADTPDPPGGVIDRDDSGTPTGIVRETAFAPVMEALRPLTPPITSDNVAAALVALASTGLTGIGAMVSPKGGLWGGATSEMETLIAAADASPIGLDAFVIAPDPQALERGAERLHAARGPIRFAGVKMFSDGSLGGHTAAMHEPFADRPQTRGTDRLEPDWAESMARKALDLGGRVAIHAIGDRANGTVLDLMERLIRYGADPARLRVEHASVLSPDDVERFGRLGITASVQPAFIASETEWLEKRLGPTRLRHTYAFRSLLEAGAPLAGGSDCPVEPPHPLRGMAAARDRLGLVPEECLTAEETLALFTEGAAAALGGRAAITPGAPADLTILDADPVDADPEALRVMNVEATWVKGEPVAIPSEITTWPI